MSTFEQERRSQMIDIATYRQIKEIGKGLVTLSGVAFSEKPDYDLDLTISRITDETFGVFPQMGYKVRVASKQTPEANHENLLITVKGFGVVDSEGELLYRRKVGITVIDQEVKYSWVDLLLPRDGKTPERAQPQSQLEAGIREHFEAWEHEISGRQFYLDPESAQMLMAEIQEIAEL